MKIATNFREMIEKKKKRLDNARPLSSGALKKLKEKLVIDWTYNSNAIEGNTLTEKETMVVLEEGVTIAGKPLKDHLEAINHKEAIFWAEELVRKKAKINIDAILKLHRIILKNINEAEAGRFRHETVFIRGSRYVPPNYQKVTNLMKNFEVWLKADNKRLTIIEKSALAHFKLVNIHPFLDGNGRTARLLMNLILMKNGYPPVIILKKERKRYFSTLEEASLKNNTVPFINFIYENLERSLDLYLFSLENKDYQRLHDFVKETSYSQEYLSLLARKRIIEAIKINGIWYAAKKEIDKYLQKIKEIK